VTTDTQFLIGSITKSFTSTGLVLKKVLKLAEAGLSYRLIGRRVGLSKNTVGAILRRARAANQ
jgi:DNA-binding NarL/FixJ family response regulator